MDSVNNMEKENVEKKDNKKEPVKKTAKDILLDKIKKTEDRAKKIEEEQTKIENQKKQALTDIAVGLKEVYDSIFESLGVPIEEIIFSSKNTEEIINKVKKALELI